MRFYFLSYSFLHPDRMIEIKQSRSMQYESNKMLALLFQRKKYLPFLSQFQKQSFSEMRRAKGMAEKNGEINRDQNGGQSCFPILYMTAQSRHVKRHVNCQKKRRSLGFTKPLSGPQCFIRHIAAYLNGCFLSYLPHKIRSNISAILAYHKKNHGG